MLANRFTELKKSVLDYHERYEAYLPATFFAGGFILDIFTLGEIDDISNIIILSIYLLFAIGILALEFLEVNKLQTDKQWLQKVFEFRLDIFHFFLGALLSAFTLFYFKSSSLSNSFTFLVLMIAILLLNETSYLQKNGVIVRSVLIMLSLVSYLILLIPTLFGTANVFIFFLCIIISLGLSIFAFWLLARNIQDKRKPLARLLYPQLAVLGVFVVLYMTKVLPPVPLSIKNIAIYYEIQKYEGAYVGRTLNPSWKFWNNGDQDFIAYPKDKIYVAVNVFSPAGFEGKVFMHWLFYQNDEWKTSDRIPLKIIGGRKGGFRGYSYKANYQPGEWQVRLETVEGLEIGRINFDISKADSTPDRLFRQIPIK